MGARADLLAERFVRAHAELLAVAGGCSAAQWRARCPAEGWSVGVVVQHVAADYLDVLAVISAIAAGRPAAAVTRDLLEERNARQAEQFARSTQGETLALLQRNGATVAATIQRLSDEQLARRGQVFDRETSVEQLVVVVLPGHIQGHLASIQAAV